MAELLYLLIPHPDLTGCDLMTFYHTPQDVGVDHNLEIAQRFNNYSRYFSLLQSTKQKIYKYKTKCNLSCSVILQRYVLRLFIKTYHNNNELNESF